MSADPQAFPVSYAQQRLWLLEQLAPGSPRYSLGAAVRIDADVDAPFLARAVAEIVRRHEALRTTFRAIDGEPVQVVHASMDVPVEVDDLRALDPALRESESARLVDSVLRRPFDLASGPLARLRLVRLADERHLLVLAMHHIVSDGWSVGVFLRELTALYRAFAGGRPSPLPPLPVQYVDYAIWQREWLASGTLARQMDYWRGQLDGLGVLELPTDRPRPAEPGYGGARHRFTLPLETADRIRALCAAEGVTPFMALLAGFTVLLHRYSGQDDVVLGTPVAGRNRPELEELIGFFVNTLVLRVDLSGNPTFREVLHRVRGVALEAWSHQEAPFEKLVEELRPVRDPSRNPLFQVTFQLQQFGAAGAPAAPAQAVDVDAGSAAFDLSADLWEEGDSLGGRIEYSTDLFDAATIERMARHYALLLDRLSAAPELPLGAVSLLSDDEWAALLDWNRTVAGPAPFVPVQRRFRAAARRAPDAVAVRDGAVWLSYGELAGRVGALCARQRAAGVTPGAVVAIRLPRSADLAAAMLAVLDAGAAYLPLDPAHPPARAAHQMADAGARFILTSGALADEIAPDGVTAILVDAAAAEPAPDAVQRAPRDPAYIVYTSGSTGTPKGCVVSHGALSNHCDAVARHYGLTPDDRALQFAAPAFDVTAEEVFPTLASGAAVCVCPPSAALDLEEFTAFVRREGVTVLNLPPDFWQAWLDWLEDTGTGVPESVRLLVVGSAAVQAQAMARWRRLAGGAMRVCNAYGVSEATITSTLFEVPAAFRAGASPTVPIGRPIANTSVWLLDRYRQPVPVGVPGELHLGGAGVAAGYVGAPERTAGRFFAHAFPGGPELRLYRTGDRACMRPDGTVECLGRVDEQISLRGFRIEPEEVEAALEAHASVERAAVVAVERDGGSQLVAWIVARPGAPFGEAGLRSFLATRLPRYMVPTLFARLDALPLTPGGKVDRRALRARPVEAAAAPPNGAEPAAGAEALLARIWAEVLGLPRVGVHDNFFALGGDSILGIRMLSRAAQAGLRLSPMHIFQHQTVAELAAVAGTDAPRPAAAEVVEDEPFGLTPVQRWFFAQELVHPEHYNQSLLLALDAEVDADALDRALAAVVAHHDALRLRFTRGDAGWRQRYGAPPARPLVAFEDVSALSAGDRAARVEARCAAAQAEMDLAEGPLLRSLLFRCGPAEFRLFIAIHHLAVDGVSWRVLVEDLWAAYRDLARGEAVRLPPRTAPLREWTSRLRDYAASDELRASFDRFLAAPFHRAGPLPVDFPGGGNTVGLEASVEIGLAPDETEALLRQAPAACRCEINDLLLTALGLALCEWSGHDACVVDVEGHGREPLFDDLDLSRTVGWFTSICPRLLHVGGAPDALAALRRVKEHLRSLPHHGVGFGVASFLGDDALRSRLGQLPPREVCFNYMGRFDGASAAPRAAEKGGPTRHPAQERGYLLELNGHVAGAALKFEIGYSRGLHAPETIHRVAHRFAGALRGFANDAAAVRERASTPSDFPLANLTQVQLDKLVRRFSAPPTAA